MQQAARVSDQTAFMYMGSFIEYADTNTLFTTPSKKKTEDYITGRVTVNLRMLQRLLL